MLRNYLTIALRNLLKHKVFSFVNIFGLAVGLVAFLFIIHYVRYERSYEDFHTNADNIFRITLDLYNGAEYIVTDCETYAPVGPLLTETMPEVLDYVRMFHNDGLQDIRVGDQNFLEEGLYFADPSVFTIFSLDVLSGDAQNALTNPMQAVLTSSMANKYYGHTDIVGETIQIDNRLYMVTAVIADLPPNTHLKFGMLLSHSTMLKIYEWYSLDSWSGNNEYTYLLMLPGTDLFSFNQKLKDFSISLKDKISNEQLVAERIGDIHLHSTKSYEPEPPGNARTVYFLFIIAVFIIVIAWVNYINLATARAVERAREVGIRKVMGSAKTQLIIQFLSESIILSLLAGCLAFFLFYILFPSFRDMTGQPLPLDFMSDSVFWYLFFGLLLGGSLLSGFYPALVLSSFQPVTVLKGKFQSSLQGQRLRKGLVIFQFSATVILLVCMVTVFKQINHLRNYDLGMNLERTLVVRAPRLALPDSIYLSACQSLKTELLRSLEIQRVARSESVPGLSMHELSSTSDVKRIGLENEGGSYNYYHYQIDADFIPTMNMKLVAGRNFQDGVPNYDLVIINEEAVSRLGFSSVEEAIGARITYHTRWLGEPATIIGVLSNFYQRSPKEAHIPMIFRYEEWPGYFSLQFKTDNTSETVASVQKVWRKVFPNSAFYYFFLDRNYDQQYKADAQFGKVMATFSGLIILIACLGLFGLSSYTIVQRTKEIGIRKVMGASVGQIVRLLSQDFMKVVLIASLLALPIAYFAMEKWLSNYSVRIDLSVWIFTLPILIILIIALATVSFQTIKTAIANPTNSLRQE
ncbi:MAG: ABC transporter permease [Cyclobacteriaceae bacterium]|nr:ABC transporter permease [Cyclobacteriaceae bacterium]